MSFFNKVFASVGIGASTVDTRLEKDHYMPGELVRGEVQIRGGNTEQQIDSIYLTINTTYLKESNDKKFTVAAKIDQVRLTENFTIMPNETKSLPVSFTLPIDTPISIGKTKIWVATGLDIKNAVDPTDKDYIKVHPNRLMNSVLDAISDLGFRLREADCEEAPYRLRRRLPFVQEFEFVPVSGPFRGRLDELEAVFFPSSENEAEIILQVDRKARGLGGFLAEALEMDETNVRITVSTSDIPNMKQKIFSVIEKFA